MDKPTLAASQALKVPRLALIIALALGAALLLGFALVVNELTLRAEQAHERQRMTGNFGAEPPSARAQAVRQRPPVNTRALALAQP